MRGQYGRSVAISSTGVGAVVGTPATAEGVAMATHGTLMMFSAGKVDSQILLLLLKTKPNLKKNKKEYLEFHKQNLMKKIILFLIVYAFYIVEVSARNNLSGRYYAESGV
ncbi:hypothetical protein, partial [Coprobacter fastidiosus]